MTFQRIYGPPAEFEKLGPLTGPGEGKVIFANWSRQERDSVSQTPSVGKCWHS